MGKFFIDLDIIFYFYNFYIYDLKRNDFTLELHFRSDTFCVGYFSKMFLTIFVLDLLRRLTPCIFRNLTLINET